MPVELAARMTVGQAGQRYAESREALGRSPATVEDYRSIVRVHFEPFFGAVSIDQVTSLDVEAYMAQKRREGRSPKSVANDLSLLSSIFRHAIRRGWRTRPANPVESVERPKVPRRSTKLEFLDQSEFEALLRACLDTEIGQQDRAMYLVARHGWPPASGAARAALVLDRLAGDEDPRRARHLHARADAARHWRRGSGRGRPRGCRSGRDCGPPYR
ncbi:MAG: site-specific integrase, partial [Thermoleophilaceae bacterium]|nr:site-specific integrase [Thermoleophilaceae bacterium]